MTVKGISLRSIPSLVKELNEGEESVHRNSVRQVTRGNNYTIETLLLVLDALDKKLVIVDRTEEDKKRIDARGKTETEENQ